MDIRRVNKPNNKITTDKNVIKFYSNTDKYFEFSNFYMVSVTIDGITYPSSEHAYQAHKFLGPDCTERSIKYAGIVGSVNTCNKAKILATQKRVGGYKWKTDLNPIIEEYSDVKLRSDWDDVKDDIMRNIVYAKFTQHSKLKKLLLSTGTDILQENSPRDSYWGIGNDGKGKNILGLTVMSVRDELAN